MKLTTKAIDLIKASTRLKNRLALELEVSGYSVERWIKENNDNDNLTKAQALEIIGEETGLNQSEILDRNEIKEVV